MKWRGGTVGYTFQEASSALNPVYTVGFQLVETVRCHGRQDRKRSRKKARELLASLGLDDVDWILESYPHQLSGGQAQRVMLALALAGDPELLIADEPTSALDTVTKMEILRLLEKLATDRELGLLLVSHDLQIIRDTVDRILVMYAGEIVEDAPADRLFHDPLHPYTRHLLGSRHGADDRTARRRSPPDRSRPPAEPDTCAFAPRCALARPSCHSSRPMLLEVADDRRLRCPVVAEGLAGHDA
jgi:peptide/nickel transport system ATP-binding protein